MSEASKSDRIQLVFEKQRSCFFDQPRTSAEERIQKLLRLKRAFLAKKKQLHDAIYQDYRKPPVEVDISEVYSTVVEMDYAIRHLKRWMKPKRVGNPLLMWTSRSSLYYEPKGVVLIIGPWNYPCTLVLIPLISAIAAGNRVMIKPSELTRNTSQFLVNLISECFPEEEVAVFEGGPEVSQKLLQLPLDHIFFTGSTRVGRVVMEAAARNLTPVTLELGGKSPTILDESADLKESAYRICWGKFFNAGQTCVAPDYVFVPENRLQDWISHAKTAIATIYGQTEEDREKSTDLCRVISRSHYERLKKLAQESVAHGARVEIGGKFNDSQFYVSPTILSNVSLKNPILEEEIFGPILPVLPYRSLNEVYGFIRSKGKPLALYIFSQSRPRIEEILSQTSAGGTCVNNTIVHLANPCLPFGGIGQSGIGSYHGYHGFKTFSHERAVLRQGIFNVIKLLYPPYGKKQKQLIETSIQHFTR